MVAPLGPVVGRPLLRSAAELVAARAVLMQEITAKVERYGNGNGGSRLDAKVIALLGSVPREKFVPMMEQADAYADQPLPIGHRQTISQPLIVAYMTHHLHLSEDCKVLEIGTGSGYQTAVLASLARHVVTVENVAVLAAEAKIRLIDLGYRNIRFIEGDGRLGCLDHGPFDRIIVTAAAETMPKALLDQLTPNGRLVLPLGDKDRQHLFLVTKDGAGEVMERRLFPVGFVPLTYGRG